MKYRIQTVTLATLIALTLGCSKQAQQDSEQAAESAADSMEQVANTIRTISNTADQVKDISTRIKGIQGVELTHTASTWEYKVVSLTGATAEATEKELNALGGQGWELVTRMGDGNNLVFKRRNVIGVREKTPAEGEPNEEE